MTEQSPLRLSKNRKELLHRLYEEHLTNHHSFAGYRDKTMHDFVEAGLAVYVGWQRYAITDAGIELAQQVFPNMVNDLAAKLEIERQDKENAERREREALQAAAPIRLFHNVDKVDWYGSFGGGYHVEIGGNIVVERRGLSQTYSARYFSFNGQPLDFVTAHQNLYTAEKVIVFLNDLAAQAAQEESE